MSCKDTWMAPVLQKPGHLGLSICDAGNFSMTLLQGNLTRKLIHRMKKGITAWDFMQTPQLRQPAAILTKIFLLLFPGIHIHRVNTQGAGARIYQRWGHSIIMKRQEDSRREGWDGGVGWEVGKSLQPSDCNALLWVTTARSRWRRSLKSKSDALWLFTAAYYQGWWWKNKYFFHEFLLIVRNYHKKNVQCVHLRYSTVHHRTKC